jgi:hypothetical protein
MPTLPHDISDLHLAPVLLALDARIDELGQLDVEQLTWRVALATNGHGWTREERDAELLEAIGHLIDCHDWTLSWDPRGLRLTHGDNSLVLGVPATFAEYLSGAPRARGHGAII